MTYTAVLPVPRRVVAFVANLHEKHFAALHTRPGRRALSAWDQSLAFCRVMLQDVEPDQSARDTGIARSTAHLRMRESEQLLAAQAPSLKEAMVGAAQRGYRHVNLDGTLIEIDRVSIPGPTTRKNTTRSGPKRLKVDLWWSGKHKRHGGNVQVVTAPDGWPLWVSDVRPGREHDVTAARTDPELLDQVDRWRQDGRTVLADLGYEGEAARMLTPVKADANGTDRAGEPVPLSPDQQTRNALHSATRARAEAGNALLKQTFKALRHVRVDPWRIGSMTAAALVLLHLIYDRIT
ncbi:transposase family protein [Quadrisphaera oryzae]|uniref:transposase family protein n=1 Tax=Quadrisphaera TaxID=317661 RepID=UPI00351C63D4